MSGELAARHLTVSYRGNNVLRDVSLQVQHSEFVAVVGRSGVGKSTLLHALAGLIPYDGEVDRPPTIGMVFQRDALFPWLTVEANIAVGLRNLPRLGREKRVSQILESMGLSSFATRYPSQLSGGQAQRVAVARAIAPAPEAIFMDEPFGSLDLLTREEMQMWLQTVLREKQVSILFVTHSIEEALFLADRIIVVDAGAIRDDFPITFSHPREVEIKYEAEFLELKRRVALTLSVAS